VLVARPATSGWSCSCSGLGSRWVATIRPPT
jgi:hypothetical protein